MIDFSAVESMRIVIQLARRYNRLIEAGVRIDFVHLCVIRTRRRETMRYLTRLSRVTKVVKRG